MTEPQAVSAGFSLDRIVLSASKAGSRAQSNDADDLSREVYGVLGIPVDAIDMPEVIDRIGSASAAAAPFLLSTPNLNFLIACQSDAEFRESLELSDLCTADGTTIVWIARLMGIPITARVAGADIFEALKTSRRSQRPLRVFLFGGEDGVAAAAGQKLNDEQSALICVGAFNPGFGSINAMSVDTVIDAINASQADILAVSLGAKKGQEWLLRNHDRLRVAVRSHLGATINFQACTVKRAPALMRQFGLEWLWRIKEEPHLWRRYGKDGLVLLKLMLARILPLAIFAAWQRLMKRPHEAGFSITPMECPGIVTLKIEGDATACNVTRAISSFRSALMLQQGLVLDFSAVRIVDARFIGALLMLRKQLKKRAQSLEIVGMSSLVERIFRLNGFGYLLFGAGERVGWPLVPR